MSIEQKVAIVTGSGSGIGEATAKRYAQDGFKIVLNGRTKQKLERVAGEIGNENVLIVEGDVSDEVIVDKIIKQTIEQWGRIDVLVNNAAIAIFEDIEHFSVEDWDAQMAINTRSVFLMTKKTLPPLLETNGSIVNVSSASGIGGDWNGFCYNASKAAVANFTRALALDLGPQGVRINAVAPSLTDTDMADMVMSNPEVLDTFKSRIPMQRAAQPEEVADVIAFLTSHDARFVNGVVLPVDGGVTASNGQPNLT